MKIVTLTQHMATAEQVSAGVFEPADKDKVKALITFTSAPESADMAERAEGLARIALDEGAEAAMIGGAPYFMAPIEKALKAAEVRPCYSFTERRATEAVDPATGEVRKTQVFVHAGWVWAD